MAKVKETELVAMEDLKRASGYLKLLSHPIRLRIADILTRTSLPVHRIAELCHLPPHQTCEHLRLMLGQGALASQRHGREVYYSVASPRLPGILKCVRKHSGL